MLRHFADYLLHLHIMSTGDVLARIYELLDNEHTEAGSSRKNFYSTCKALRVGSVISIITENHRLV